MSLADDMKARIARYGDRREDWTVFGFETQLDPKFARSQRRYVGASGSVDHNEANAVAPVAFTMSIQTMPPGNKIPAHCHETEETFFILDGECTVNIFRDGETHTVKLGRWDLISVPAFVHHDIHNFGPGSCAIQTLLSKPQPNRPHYRDERLLKLQANTYTK
ncbi:MAG: cupin domain-containing protein [Rhodospirillales bacterium]|nr:cupin domain-containing protein [Rhodospirillales bacterium]